MNNNTLEYVLSGTGYMRIHTKGLAQETNDFINECLLRMNKAFPEQKISFLYNGWTEQDLGRHLAENFSQSMPNMYADSGGLQVITRGKQITEEMKQGVYENQAKYASRAFIFDEIPVSFTGTKSARLDITTRWYDMDKFEGCARRTGQNVAKQIETFLDMKSKARPVFIVQGNCYETCMDWTRLALEEIPKEHHKYIGAAAMSFSSMGFGMLEDIRRAFYFTQLPFEIDHVHLLGVGAVARLIPQLLFCQTGVYKDTHISYDSTSHSGSIITGRFFIDGGDMRFPRQLDNIKWPRMFNSIKDKFDLDLSLKEFHDILNSSSKDIDENYGSRDKQVQALSAAILAQTWNFMNSVEGVYNSPEALFNVAKKKKCDNIIKSLAEVKTLEDFNYWEHHLGRFVESKRIVKDKPMTLHDFFE